MKRALLNFLCMALVFGTCWAQEQAVLVRKIDKTRFAIKNADVDSMVMKKANEVDKKWFGADTVLTVTPLPYNADVPVKTTLYQYEGEYVSLDSTGFAYLPFVYNAPVADAATCSNQYIITINEEQGKLYLYNGYTKKVVAEKSVQGIQSCITFGKKASAADVLPVLYVVCKDASGNYEIQSLRLQTTLNEEGTEITDFTIQTVQTINMAQVVASKTILNMAYDAQKGYVCLVCCNNNIEDADYLRWHVVSIALPSGQNATLSPASIKSDFVLKNLDENYVVGEGAGSGFVYDGKLYIAHNTPDGNTTMIYVVNLAEKQMQNELDMKAAEMEDTLTGVINYNDQLVMTTKTKKMYKVIFD